jgi:hypothetical protein
LPRSSVLFIRQDNVHIIILLPGQVVKLVRVLVQILQKGGGPFKLRGDIVTRKCEKQRPAQEAARGLSTHLDELLRLLVHFLPAPLFALPHGLLVTSVVRRRRRRLG